MRRPSTSSLFLGPGLFILLLLPPPEGMPPNAIVFGSHLIHVQQMAKAGFWLNILGVFLITAFVYLWLPEFH